MKRLALKHALAMCALLAGGVPAVNAVDVGTVAPACELQSLVDQQALRTADFQGKVLVVDFWASWCGPCAQSFPFLNELHEELGGRGLQIVGINLDEKPGDATTFLTKHPANFTVVMDAEDKRCPKEFGVKAMPTSYLIDRKGVVRHVHLGFRPGEAREELRLWIERLLDEKV